MVQPVLEMACRALGAPMAMLFIPGAAQPRRLGGGRPSSGRPGGRRLSTGVPPELETRLARLCAALAAGGDADEAALPFRATAPLVTGGRAPGVLCVCDVAPRSRPTASQQADLETLAHLAAQLLAMQARATRAAQHASAAARMAEHVERQLCGALGLLGTALQARARQSGDVALRDALFTAADSVAGLEAAFEQLRNPVGFAGDIRAFLLALIGNLQEAVGDLGSCSVVLQTPDPPPVVPEERFSSIGLAALAMLVRALRQNHAPVELALRREDGLLLSIAQPGPGLPPDPQDGAMLPLLSALAVPGGVSVNQDAGRRITVRLAE
jgi:hypothetical protein